MSMLFDVPAIRYRAALLEPEDRVTLGNRDERGEPLGERISIGGPEVAPVTAERAAGDDEVLQTLAQHAGNFQFQMVVLGCTFEPYDNERFDRAWVQIRLSADGAKPAIAWSMFPARSTRAYTLSRQIEVGATLQFAAAKVSGGEEREGEEAFVEARNLLRSDPTWRFTRIEGQEIRDEHRLVLMVKAPADVQTTGEIRLRAILRRRNFGLISYKVSVPEAPYERPGDPLSGRFVLGAGGLRPSAGSSPWSSIRRAPS